MLQSGFMAKIIDRVPKETLQAYKEYKLTSYDLAELLDVHPVSVRRAIKRPPRQTQKELREERQTLLKARRAFRATLAHKPIQNIMAEAYVSRSTAYRIKKRNGF